MSSVVVEMEDLTEEGDEYGQREPLTRRIRTLLKDYPDGLPVPKELIQNADDAQATKACLLLDLRTHSAENLINPKLAQFQGPALVFWDNKPFQESDFENLCEFCGETKLGDRKKVGKFGLGFNSVYNVTDLPQFVSKSSFCILDPHEKFLNGKRGRRFDLTKNLSDGRFMVDAMKGHLEPFEKLFGFSRDDVKNGEKFDGTIFRFPLRSPEHVKWSKISSMEYSKESALELLEMTKVYADLFLIFLQFVNEVEIATITDSDLQLHTVAHFKRSFQSESMASQSRVFFNESDLFQTSYQIKIEDSVELKSYEWDIHVIAPGLKSELDGTRCVGAIAFPSNDLKLESNTDNQLLFCFLPLPHPPSTGLPFLVNGSFAVTSSRRHLELDAVDDKSDQKRIEGQWNRDILQRAAAPALCDAVLVKASTHTQDQLFNLFPGHSSDTERLCRIVSDAFYKKLTTDCGMKVFSCPLIDELVSFADTRVVIIADDIPEDIRASLLKCAQYSGINEAWISLTRKVQTALRSFDEGRLKAKEQNFSYFFGRLISNAKHLFTECKPQYLMIIYHALKVCHDDAGIKQTLQSIPWVVAGTDINKESVQVKIPVELLNPHSIAADLLYFTSKFFPSEQMKFTNEQLIHMNQTFGLNNLQLPRLAIPEVIANLNSLRDFATSTAKLRQYFEHLNANEQVYRRANLAGYVCSGVLIPIKERDTGEFKFFYHKTNFKSSAAKQLRTNFFACFFQTF